VLKIADFDLSCHDAAPDIYFLVGDFFSLRKQFSLDTNILSKFPDERLKIYNEVRSSRRVPAHKKAQ